MAELEREAAGMELVPNRVTTGKHLMTILFGIWLIIGVFIDGYAHNHGVAETFFTPWHAILYSGYAASAIWMISLVYRRRRMHGTSWRAAIPRGYEWGLAGVVIFFAGGIGDMVWHIIFGIEENLEALLSPTHLLLLAGAILIVSSPFRAASGNPDMKEPGWKEFLPPFLSMVFSTAAAAFFLMYAWMFRYNLASRSSIDWYSLTFNSRHIASTNEVQGLVFILLDTVVYMFPVLLLMKRWKLPFGAVAALFGSLTALMGVLDGFENFLVIPVSVAAGFMGDLAYLSLMRGKHRVWAMHAVALAAPLALWSFYFIGMHLVDGIGWTTELWTGAIVKAGLASLALSILAQPGRHSGS